MPSVEISPFGLPQHEPCRRLYKKRCNPSSRWSIGRYVYVFVMDECMIGHFFISGLTAVVVGHLAVPWRN